MEYVCGVQNFTKCACADGGEVRKDYCGDGCDTAKMVYNGITILMCIMAGAAYVPATIIALR
jgi:hypothetical protein